MVRSHNHFEYHIDLHHISNDTVDILEELLKPIGDCVNNVLKNNEDDKNNKDATCTISMTRCVDSYVDG